jgi:hypothetical protein
MQDKLAEAREHGLRSAEGEPVAGDQAGGAASIAGSEAGGSEAGGASTAAR